MKKNFLFLMAFLMAFSVQWTIAQTTFDGGDGQENSPWQISSVE